MFKPSMLPSFVVLVLLPNLVHSVGLAPGLYCGTVTCYDVLEISRDDFNKTDLPRIYRRLARQYHPDRAKRENREEAEEQFRLVATAYETLKDDETREYYDYYLDHPEERYYNYYQYYRLRTAPRVDVRIVIVVAILLVSTIQYLSAHQKYREALKYAKEQVKFRTMAIDIARERGVLDFDKLTGKVKKKQKNGIDAEATTEQKLIDEYLIKELWKRDVFDQWKHEKDLEEKEKLAKSGRYKQYQRFQRKNAG
uniref:J domain-containing protein n=1 Tax=Meloidogyne javanica TaxID=6303 RepID=A0A915MJH9_MELJA